MSKNTTKKVETQPPGGEHVSANHLSAWGLVSRVYKELLKFNETRNTQLKREQRLSIDTPPKKIYTRPTSTGKGASQQMQIKMTRDTTSPPLGWL